MRAPCPNRMPFGLIRNTRPLDCNAPRICEGSCPTTRFSTALAAFCWMKRVVSLAPIEKPCQLMMAFGLLVTFSVLPLVAKLAVPLTTAGPTGLAKAAEPKAEAISAAPRSRRGRSSGRGRAGAAPDARALPALRPVLPPVIFPASPWFGLSAWRGNPPLSSYPSLRSTAIVHRDIA